MKRSDRTARSGQCEGESRREFLKSSGAVAAGVISAGIVAWPEDLHAAGEPIWQMIPNQTWAVGVPVYLRLADYATSQIGAELIFSLNQALPNGVSLQDGVIRGTPTAAFNGSGYFATAQDGVILNNVPPGNSTGLNSD